MIVKKLVGVAGGALLLAVTTPSTGHAIPAWARKYNVSCSHCHAPAVPRLNALGIRFRWAGYRMPEEIGEVAKVEKIQDYISIRGRVQYAYEKPEDKPVSTSAFQFSDATFFYSGPFGKNYGAFFELEREPNGEMGLQAHIDAAWGKEKSYGGFKVGYMHWLQRDGVAGFDRPTGLRTPTPHGSALTAKGIPFSFSPDQFGLELYYALGRNRISGQVLNGVNRTGGGGGADVDTKKDFVLTDQFLFDEAGSGVTAVGYYGTLVGADPLAKDATSHFWRVALSANKFIKRFEMLAGVVLGQDTDLPVVTGGAFPKGTVKALGYYGYAGYSILPKGASNALTVYTRYETIDPDTDVDTNSKSRFIFGGVLPILRPEHLRLAAEYAKDSPQTGTGKSAFTLELMVNF